MIYWTTYNFIGYSLMKMKLVPINAPLKTSIIVTSIIGGYMTYVYPRKLVFRIGDKKFKPPYYCMILADLLFHQVPMLDILRLPNEINLCGAYIFFPMYLWKKMNERYVHDTKKIYGMDYNKMFLSTLGLFGIIGAYSHSCKYLNNGFSKIIPNMIKNLLIKN